jgi:hypothetical protein
MVRSTQSVHLSCVKIITSPNGLNRASTWATSPRSTIRVCPKWFLSLWYVWCKLCTYLASRLALSLNGMKQASTWVSSPSSTIGCIQKWFMSLWHVWHKPYTYLASTLTLYPNGSKRDSTWPKSARSYIGCVQNDFWAYGTLGAKRAPMLRHN